MTNQFVKDLKHRTLFKNIYCKQWVYISILRLRKYGRIIIKWKPNNFNFNKLNKLSYFISSIKTEIIYCGVYNFVVLSKKIENTWISI